MEGQGNNVETTVAHGRLRGQAQKTASGCVFYGFRGIPYARPPVGKLRFKPPQPAEPWEGTRDALEEGPMALQIESFIGLGQLGQEDCLYLNVYTPDMKPKSPLPVMVWIHGGGFVSGSGNADLYGPDFLVEAGVVLVTFNYRLNIFGFLTLNNEEAPGNLGLKDQVHALRWVQENIASFGGDPDNVTIFGESAGGASVHYHVLSPLSKGLFKRAIAQSGSALNPWAVSKTSYERAFRVGAALGFQGGPGSDSELLEFLGAVDAVDLLKASENSGLPMENASGATLSFTPSLEPAGTPNAFMTEPPRTVTSSGRFNKVPFIVGITETEGMLFLKGLYKNPTHWDKVDANFPFMLPRDLLTGLDEASSKKLVDQIKAFYMKGKLISKDTAELFVHMLSDVQFGNGVVETARHHSAHVPVYMYHFSVESSTMGFKHLIGIGDMKGTCHGDELGYLFFSSLLKSGDIKPGSVEHLTSQRLVNLWTNFAKTGNPTEGRDTNLVPVDWPRYTESEPNYLSIGEQISVGRELNAERIQFWRRILNN